MTKIERLIAGICLTIGCIFLSIPVAVSLEAQPTIKNRNAAWGGLILGLPPALWGAWVLQDTRKKRHWHDSIFQFKDREIDLMFVRLLDRHHGSITVLQLATNANLTIDEARLYLDLKSIQLHGDFEIADNGGIVYHFPVV